MSALLVLLAFGAGAAGSSAGGGRPTASLDLYTGVVSSETLARIVRQGYDIADARPGAGGVQVDLVLTKAEVAKLRRDGVDLQPRRDAQGRSQAQRAAEQAASGFTVWRSYDAPGGIRDELYDRPAQLADREARGDRAHAAGARDRRAEGHEKCEDTRRRHAAGRPLHVARSTRASGSPPRSTAGCSTTSWTATARTPTPPTSSTRPSCGSCWSPTRTATSTHSTTQRLWRKNLRDNDGDGQITGERRRRPEPQLQRRLGLRQRGLVDAARRATTYRGTGPGVGAGDTGASRA